MRSWPPVPPDVPTVRHLLAVDVGATKTLVTLRDAASVDGPWRSAPVDRFATPRDPAAAADAIAASATRLLRAHGRGPIAAAAVVAPGPLDAAAGRIDFSPNLGWRDVPFAGWLTARLGVPVALEDDATAAALGEAHGGAGRGADPFVYLTVSSGVGAGVVVDGRSLRGAHGLAGEVGHLVIDPDGPRCGCGRRGDVEAYAGGASLARRARATWPGARLADGGRAPRDAAAVFDRARAGDPDALRLVEEAAEAVARAIAALAGVLDPAVIAVGGSLALGQPWLRRRARVIARRRAMAETGRRLVVVRAALGDESCLAGATVLAGALAAR